MVIRTDLSSITLAGGAAAAVNWGGPATQAINALVEQPLSITTGGSANLIIDFDVPVRAAAGAGSSSCPDPGRERGRDRVDRRRRDEVRRPGAAGAGRPASVAVYRNSGFNSCPRGDRRRMRRGTTRSTTCRAAVRT
jgi:hypothetical protein